ncbi:MAG: hypothetical protein V2A76_13370 [Planctomycetota bacterium]
MRPDSPKARNPPATARIPIPPLRAAARILLGGGAVFVVLLAAFPILSRAYTPAFRAGAEVLARMILGDSVAGVEALPSSKHHTPDTRLTIIKRQRTDVAAGTVSTEKYWTDLGSYHHGYMPFAVFLSLLLVSRVPWKGRVRPFLVGALLVHVYVACRILMALYHAYVTADIGGHRVQDGMNPTIVFLIGAARNLICEDHVTAFVIPALVWAAVILLGSPDPRTGKQAGAT